MRKALLLLLIVCLPYVWIPSVRADPLIPQPPKYNVTLSDPSGGYQGFYSFSLYRLPLPNASPVKVPVAVNVVFPVVSPNASKNYASIPYNASVLIPRGNYSAAVLKVAVREFGGAQYDRPLYVYANGIPVFWGSTQEINNSSATSDLTLFENMLKGRVNFTVVLPNFLVPKLNITGKYSVNVTLLLYPGSEPKGLPNAFIPLGSKSYGYYQAYLTPKEDLFQDNLTLPEGTFREAMLLYTEGGYLDEFWYANEPATRSVLVLYNGYLADVINPFETIYTGGINLFWWKPMPSINTLSFHNPYVSELTPLLATGNRVNLTLTVTNLGIAEVVTGSPLFSWTIAGVLLLWVNQSNPMISGDLLRVSQLYADSGPIFSQGTQGNYYQEGGRYNLEYAASLRFQHGQEFSTVNQSGSFYAYQTLTSIYEGALLDENFQESSSDTGIYNASLQYQVSYPLSLQYSALGVPESNPQVIPYNVSLVVNGTLSLALNFRSVWTYGSSVISDYVLENLTALGGYAALFKVINKYGSAIEIGLSQNFARTVKQLYAVHLVDGRGQEEIGRVVALSPNSTNTSGYYVQVSVIFRAVPDPPIHRPFLLFRFWVN